MRDVVVEFERVTVIMPDGQRFGPADLDTVKSWIRDRRVPPGAELIDEATGRRFPADGFTDAVVARKRGAAVTDNEPMSSIIPYRNGAALLAYYLGIFSLLACVPLAGFLGVVMAGVAVAYGVKGLRAARERPEAKGKVHAWIGIVAGGVCGLVGLVLNIAIVVAIVADM